MILQIPAGVYEPREDAELLARNIEIKDKGRVLDVGTGPGALALLAARLGCKVVVADINPAAITAAKQNARINGIKNIGFVFGDLFQNITGYFDLMIFKPPYLPVCGEDLAWSGSKYGHAIIKKFAEEVKNYLSPSERFLLVISSITGLAETKRLFEQNGLKVIVKDKLKIPFETL